MIARIVLLNFAGLASGQFAAQAFGFLTNAWLARRIAPSGFGAIGLAQATLAYFGIFADSGLRTMALREAAQNPARIQRLIDNVCGLRLSLAAVLVPLVSIAAGFLPYSPSTRAILRIYAFTLLAYPFAVDWVFHSLNRMHYAAAVQVFGSLAMLLLAVAWIARPEHVLRVPFATLFSILAAGALALLLLRRLGYRLRPSADFSAWRACLSQALPLCASSLAIALYTHANTLILGAVHGDSAAGLYAAASKLAAVFSVFTGLYYASIIPTLMRLHKESQAALAAALRHSVRFTAIAAAGFFLVAVAAGERLIVWIFGPAFSGASPAFYVLAAGAAVVAVGHNWGQLAIASHRERRLLGILLTGGAVNLVLAALLVERFSCVGVAVANLCAEIAVHLLLLLAAPPDMGFGLLGAALRPVYVLRRRCHA